MNELQEFIQVFGQRYIGLVDNVGLYNSWRVPRPEAPYSQDYIIDQNGYIRYWSDEYDPKEIIKTIDKLLVTGIEEPSQQININKLSLTITPNPAKSRIRINVGQSASRGFNPANSLIKIYDSSGRLIDIFKLDHENSVVWNKKVSCGIYFIQLESHGKTITRSFIFCE